MSEEDAKAALAATTVPLRGEPPVPETLPPGAATVGDPGLIASARALAAKTIGRFEIKSQLGAGGMGVVLLATDPLLGRKIALKVLHRGATDDRAKRRLMREAQGIAQVTHDNVIVVHEVGTHDDQVFVAMEYVSGGTLTHWQNGERTWREILAMYQLAGRGLVAAHEAGLVHRDFKGDNVLVGDDGRVRVTDFGLVAAMGAGESGDLTKTEQALRKESELAVSLTQTGAVMGTPRYMAPEQHLGQPLDARADQFAFCVALYEALYKQAPFAGENYQVLMCNVLAAELVPPPESSDVPRAIRDAVLRGLSRNRDDRHTSVRALLDTLALDEPPPVAAPPKRRWWLVAAIVVPLVGGAGGVGYWFYDRAATAETRAQRLEQQIGSAALATDDEPASPRPWALGVSTANQKQALELFEIGNAALVKNDFAAAEKSYGYALQYWNHPAIHFNLALALMNLDRKGEASEHLEAAMLFPAALDADKIAHAKEYRKLLRHGDEPHALDVTGPTIAASVRLVDAGAEPRAKPVLEQPVTQPLEITIRFRWADHATLLVLTGEAHVTHTERGVETAFVTTHATGSAPDAISTAAIASLAGLRVTSCCGAGGGVMGTSFHVDGAVAGTTSLVETLEQSWPDLPLFPAEPIGVGATWEATTSMQLAGSPVTTWTTSYEVLAHAPPTWTIRRHMIANPGDSAARSKLRGEASDVMTLTDGMPFPATNLAMAIQFQPVEGPEIAISIGLELRPL